MGSGIRVWQHFFQPIPAPVFLSVQESQPRQSDVVAVEERKEVATKDFRINVNQATQQELEQIPGIGPVLAKRIYEYRLKEGSFQTPEDMKKVSGIGPKKLDKISNYILIEKTNPN